MDGLMDKLKKSISSITNKVSSVTKNVTNKVASATKKFLPGKKPTVEDTVNQMYDKAVTKIKTSLLKG
jgi:phage-related protein